MLILTRRASESIVIAGDITVTVLEVTGERVKLGISAPASVLILRQELCDAVKAENLAAARISDDTPPINRFKEWLANPSGTVR
jgi:carbon storage regulator